MGSGSGHAGKVGLLALAFVLAGGGQARALTVNPDGTVSIKLNYRYPPQPDEVTKLEGELQRMQRVLCDATDGQLKFNGALVSAGDSGQEGADIWLLPQNARAFAGYQINLYRGFAVGDVMAHEFGHGLFGLGEQYEEQQRFGTACGIGPGFDPSVRLDESWNSIMQQASGYICVDSVNLKPVRDYYPDNPGWYNWGCTTDADCANACVVAGCPTDAAGNPVPFVCPAVPPRNSELSVAANHDLRRSTGDICPAPKAGSMLVLNARLDPNTADTVPRPGSPGLLCGNGSIDAGEQCDGADLAGQSCASLGFVGGALSCGVNCGLSTFACTPLPTCGNGVLDSGEECEPALGAPAGLTCRDLGFDGAGDTDPLLLACNPSCGLNVSQCPGARQRFDDSTFAKAAETSSLSGEFLVIDSLGRLDPLQPGGGQSSHILHAYFRRIQGDRWELRLLGRAEEYVGGTAGEPLLIATYRLLFSGKDLVSIDERPVGSDSFAIGGYRGLRRFTPPFVAGSQAGDPPEGATAPAVVLDLRLDGLTQEPWQASNGGFFVGSLWEDGSGAFAGEPGTPGDLQRGQCADDAHCQRAWNGDTQRFETADQTLRRSVEDQNASFNLSDWEIMRDVLADRLTLLVPDVPATATPSDADCGGLLTVPPIPTQDQVYVVVDRSGSMAELVNKPATGGQTRLDFAQAAARAFVDLQNQRNVDVGFGSFNHEATHEIDLAKVDSTVPAPMGSLNPEDFKSAIDGLEAKGATAIGDGLRLAREQLVAAPAGMKAIVLFSDGENNTAAACSPDGDTDACVLAEYQKELDELQKASITVFTIASGGAADRSTLARTASATGGLFFDAPVGDELPSVYAEVVARLRGETVALERTASAVKYLQTCGTGEFRCPAGQDCVTDPDGNHVCQEIGAPPPEVPRQQSFGIPVELGAGRLNITMSSRNAVVADWDPAFMLRDPDGNIVVSDTVGAGFVRSDPFYRILGIPAPARGTWTLTVAAKDATVQRSYLLAHVENARPDCFVRPVSTIVREGDSAVIRAMAAYDVNLSSGVTMTGTVTRPNGSQFDIELPNSLDPTVGFSATIPASELTNRGVYDVVVRCAVSGSAKAQPGESIFKNRQGVDTLATDVPAAPAIEVEPFSRSVRTAFFYDASSWGPLPPGDDCDGDGILNDLEPEGDLDSDGAPDVCDSDADNDDVPDQFDDDISPPLPVCLYASGALTPRDRSFILSNVHAGTFAIGNDARVIGSAISAAGGFLGDRSTIDNDAKLASVLSGNREGVLGQLIENAHVSLPALARKTVTVLAGSETVPNDAVVTFEPGARGHVTFRARSVVYLRSGTYSLASLNVEPDVTIHALGHVNLDVQGELNIGDRVQASAESPRALVLYSNAASLRIGTDVLLTGIVIAPDATINVYSRTEIAGCIGGRNVNFEPDVLLDGSGAVLPTSTAAGPSCVDGERNGAETDTDCGGPTCQACAQGRSCLSGADCLSAACVSGQCQGASALGATTQVTSDWGSGYCVTVRVENHAALPTSSWTVNLSTNESSIYTSWNGLFSSSSGPITIQPAHWNSVIARGTTADSVGFCANRDHPGSGRLPFVVGATGVF